MAGFGKPLGHISLAILLLTVGANLASAQDVWRPQLSRSTNTPPEIVPETRRPAQNGLPDGLVAAYSETGDIASAWYEAPTKRYGHAILGDGIEAGMLKVKTAAGETLSLTLPKKYVFEDRYPRLADLDGDGLIEVVTIRSSTSKGGSVTVYGIENGALVQRATTGFIGRANRWLNIAGIANFLGGDKKQIAYVQTPHIGGTLFFYAYANGTLTPIGSIHGFSNHVIGSTEMRLSAIADVNADGRPDLALPSDNRRKLRFVGFGKAGPRQIGIVSLPAKINKAIGIKGAGRELRFVVGVENGRVYEIRR